MRRNKIIIIVSVLMATMLTFITAYGYDEPETVFVLPDSSELDIYSARFTQFESESTENANLLADLSGYEKKLENEHLAVYFREQVQGIRILNKASGYVWGGLASDETDNLNESWSRMANSLLTIDYYDSTAQSRRLSLSSDNTDVTLSWGKDSLKCGVSFNKIGISLSFDMVLKEDTLSFKLDRDSVSETGEYSLQSVWFLPFLGAVEQDSINGYIFIPDGSGALIRYKKSTHYVSAFDERVYGKDPGEDEMSVMGDLLAKRNNDYLTDTAPVTLPVFGSVHGAEQNACFAVIDSGKEYASIYASPAGLITDYNWVSARFDYRKSYSKPLNSSGASIVTIEDEPKDFDAGITFYFLEGEDADYSGMAKLYRELLKADGYIIGTEFDDENIPLKLDVVAADIKDTIWGNGYTSLTSVSELENIVSELEENDIKNLSLVYMGWQKGGLNGASPSETAVSKKLGSLKELEELSQRITASNGRFYLNSDPVMFNSAQASAGRMGTVSITNYTAVLLRNNTNLMYPQSYFVKPNEVISSLDKLANNLDSFSLSLSSIGNRLYSAYNRGYEFTRAETLDAFREALSDMENNLLLENPNLYLWNNMSEFSEMPMQNSQYLFESDSVPFIPMLLKGSVDYYAPYANQGFYTDTCILKMIEYGAYPSFIVMAAENEEIIDTPISDYFSLNFEDWKSTITNVYSKINDALKSVEGLEITDHRMLTDGVAEVTYGNEYKIIVNYRSDDYTVSDGVICKAKDYLLRGIGND